MCANYSLFIQTLKVCRLWKKCPSAFFFENLAYLENEKAMISLSFPNLQLEIGENWSL